MVLWYDSIDWRGDDDDEEKIRMSLWNTMLEFHMEATKEI